MKHQFIFDLFHIQRKLIVKSNDSQPFGQLILIESMTRYQ
jgi:hypothetical protein